MACGHSDSDPSSTTTLCDLPAELLIEIVKQLDNPTLLSLGLTCRCVQSVALCSFFANNDIRDPVAGWLVAYKAPVETLPALRGAFFMQKMDQIHYYFNPGVERMRAEVQDLRALISRMPAIGLVKLHFSVVDNAIRGERQVLHPKVWKKELQSLLDVVLEKGCSELYIQGGEKLIELYPRHAVSPREPKAATVLPRKVLESDLKVGGGRQGQKNLLGALNLTQLTEFVHQFFDGGHQNFPFETRDSTQLVVHSPIAPLPLNIKLVNVSIHSEMLLQYPFFEWTIAMLNSRPSTIGTLSLKIADLPSGFWKNLLDGITLPKLFDFKITSEITVPRQGICFADVHSFLGRHPNIKFLHLYGVEVPKGSPVTIPILPQLRNIFAHPVCITWILNGVFLDKGAFPNLGGITISSEYRKEFNYTLFDDALECVAVFPRNINLTLSFASSSGMHHWFGNHVAKRKYLNNPSKSSVFSRLNNVTSLVVLSFWSTTYDRTTMAYLPNWLGLFPNLTAVEFMEQPGENVAVLLEKEFLRNVAMVCPKVNSLQVRDQTIHLDVIRKDFVVEVDPEHV